MPPTHLVDTDCVIHYFHQIPSVTKRIIGLGPSGIAVSIISVAELWEGVLFSDDLEGDQQELESFLAVVTWSESTRTFVEDSARSAAVCGGRRSPSPTSTS